MLSVTFFLQLFYCSKHQLHSNKWAQLVHVQSRLDSFTRINKFPGSQHSFISLSFILFPDIDLSEDDAGRIFVLSHPFFSPCPSLHSPWMFLWGVTSSRLPAKKSGNSGMCEMSLSRYIPSSIRLVERCGSKKRNYVLCLVTKICNMFALFSSVVYY